MHKIFNQLYNLKNNNNKIIVSKVKGNTINYISKERK